MFEQSLVILTITLLVACLWLIAVSAAVPLEEQSYAVCALMHHEPFDKCKKDFQAEHKNMTLDKVSILCRATNDILALYMFIFTLSKRRRAIAA